MKIKSETTDELVIEQANHFWLYVSCGSIFTLLGAWPFTLSVFPSGQNVSHLPWFVGVLFITLGILLFGKSRRFEYIFSKRTNKFLVIEKSLIGKYTKEYDIKKIKQIEFAFKSTYYIDKTATMSASNYLTLIVRFSDYHYLELCHLGDWMFVPQFWFVPPSEHIKKIGTRLAAFLSVPYVNRSAKNESPANHGGV